MGLEKGKIEGMGELLERERERERGERERARERERGGNRGRKEGGRWDVGWGSEGGT